jgi:hypothetical protein
MGTTKTSAKKRPTVYIKNIRARRLAEQVGKRTKVKALCDKLASLPVLDPRTPDEILGYDAFGIPR